MDEISEQTKLLIKYRIDTKEEHNAFIEKLVQEQVSLKSQRTEINNKLRCSKGPDRISDLKSQRIAITKRLYALRKELKAAKGIEDGRVKSYPCHYDSPGANSCHA